MVFGFAALDHVGFTKTACSLRSGSAKGLKRHLAVCEKLQNERADPDRQSMPALCAMRYAPTRHRFAYRVFSLYCEC